MDGGEKLVPGKGNRICKDLEGANSRVCSAYFEVVWKVRSLKLHSGGVDQKALLEKQAGAEL